jgi:chromosome segregation ATPase
MREASEASAEQINELRETIESLREQDAQARADAAKAFETITELQSRVSALRSELEQKRAETDHIYAERDAIAEQLKELTRNAEGARDRELALEEQLRKSNEELIASFDDIVSLANLLRNAEQSAAAFQADIDAEQKSRRSLEKQLEGTREKVAGQQQQIAALRVELADVVSSRRTLNEKKLAADAKLLALRDKYAALQSEANEAKSEMARKVAELRDQLANAASSCKALMEEKKVAEAKLSALQEKHSALHSRVGEMKSEKERKVTELRDRVANALSNCQAIADKKQVADAKLLALREKHEDLLAKQSKLSLELDQIKHSMKAADSHAQLLTRILERMAFQKIAFPATTGRMGLFGRILNNQARRWQNFCCRLAEEGIFDANAYLALHTDVAEAGIDPLVHYLSKGHAERRAVQINSVPAVGTAVFNRLNKAKIK